jgi:hypothetical protein
MADARFTLLVQLVGERIDLPEAEIGRLENLLAEEREAHARDNTLADALMAAVKPILQLGRGSPQLVKAYHNIQRARAGRLDAEVEVIGGGGTGSV